MTASCATCQFKGVYMSPQGVIGGTICRRHPPICMFVVVPNDKGRPVVASPTAWPEIDDTQWCGEYKPHLAVMS